jgi:hypothetical protein
MHGASDWIGSWSHPGGTISISRSNGGKLSIEGEHTYRPRKMFTAVCPAPRSSRSKE